MRLAGRRSELHARSASTGSQGNVSTAHRGECGQAVMSGQSKQQMMAEALIDVRIPRRHCHE